MRYVSRNTALAGMVALVVLASGCGNDGDLTPPAKTPTAVIASQLGDDLPTLHDLAWTRSAAFARLREKANSVSYRMVEVGLDGEVTPAALRTELQCGERRGQPYPEVLETGGNAGVGVVFACPLGGPFELVYSSDGSERTIVAPFATLPADLDWDVGRREAWVVTSSVICSQLSVVHESGDVTYPTLLVDGEPLRLRGSDDGDCTDYANVYGVTLSSDGKFVALTVSEEVIGKSDRDRLDAEREVMVFEVETGDLVQRYSGLGRVGGSVWRPGTHTLLLGAQEGWLWAHPLSGPDTTLALDVGQDIAFSPDGTEMLVMSPNGVINSEVDEDGRTLNLYSSNEPDPK